MATESITGFRLASLLVDARAVVILAFLASAPGTTGDVANACGLDRVTAWRLVTRDLAVAELVEPCGRQRWRTTPKGKTVLERIHYELSLIARLESDVSNDKQNVSNI